ncbi:hypothetical protein NIIDMKKI_56370 [Mycobacterium kansasii]|uniref:Uncharacterized protein n=1 Tax=Mycobacterium kansasii TaxID=1768 RepID=A0A7G1IHH6_MYCKA|nr:hypothetical protein NIIDMKKI_56370 [Mycobacterium kansasii]
MQRTRHDANCPAITDTPLWYPAIVATADAHIPSYSASAAAMAGAFCPNRFDITNCTNSLRFAATTTGRTIAVRAASNTLATALAWSAAPAARAAATLSQPA